MVLLEEIWFVAVFHSPPSTSRVGEGTRVHVTRGSGQCKGLQCTSLSPQLLVALKSAPTPPLGDLGRALFSQLLLVLRGHSDVASWLSHAGLIKFEWGLGHKLVPPGKIAKAIWPK